MRYSLEVLRRAVTGAALAAACIPLFAAAVDRGERPNIILFLADDVSWDDLGCYGHPRLRTPNLDRLAEEGMRFTNAYLTTSSCSPSRCSLITGRYPHNMGAPELHMALPEGQVLFPKLLREAGYYTVLSGKHHMGNFASTAFDQVSPGKGPGKEEDWVEIVRERPKTQPFFCWFASSDAHRGWTFDENAPRYTPAQVVVPPYLVDGPKTRRDLAAYYHEVSRMDHFVGLVREELERQSVLDNTLILFMADNGRPFPRCKTRLYDSGIKTPFIVRWPRQVKPAVTESFISSIDFAATALDVASLPKDPRIQGISFLPVLRDPAAVTRKVVFAEHNWHVYKNHERMVRSGDWLYIRNNFPRQRNLCLEGLKFDAGEELWAAHAGGSLNESQRQVVQKICPGEELYHVGEDPRQLKNLAADPERREALQQLRGALASWTEETGDTLPANPTLDRDPRPAGSDGKIGKRGSRPVKRGEMPGAARGATKINAPGPLRLP